MQPTRPSVSINSALQSEVPALQAAFQPASALSASGQRLQAVCHSVIQLLSERRGVLVMAGIELIFLPVAAMFWI